MIRPPQNRLHVTRESVTYATEFVDRSGAVQLVETWRAEDRAASGAPSSGPYPVRALLAGLFLLVTTGQPISWAGLLNLFWFQIDRSSLSDLSLTEVIPSGRRRYLRSLTRQIGKPWAPQDLRILQSEYARLAKSLDALFATIRWSPHDRQKKQRNHALDARLKALSAAEKADLALRKERQDLLINALIAGSLDTSLLAHYQGDVMFDEVVVQVAKALGNTGTRPDIKHAGNPDAGWFTKGSMDAPRWAHGVTLMMATHRPGERRVPTVVLGMSIGKPTGGDVTDAMLAFTHARSTGLLPHRGGTRAKSRVAIADMGFTIKDGMNEALVQEGYYLVQDFPPNVSRHRRLDNGAVLFNGVIICPGFETATRQPFNMLNSNATAATVRRHSQREATLIAGRMHPNGRPRLAVKAGRGRPKKGEEALNTMRVEVYCPAAANQARCPVVPTSLQLSGSVPTVPAPPDSTALPAACLNTVTPVTLPSKDFKQYGVHLYGSEAHRRLYKYARALNEQWHSQLRADTTGGIEGSVFKTQGAERVAVLVALAVAETNMAMQRVFRQRHLLPDGSPNRAA